MNRMLSLLLICGLVSCKTTTYYIVRHAEKESSATMGADVPLSATGRQRAEVLKQKLAGKPIDHVYATNYLRTKGTAQPVADARGVTVEVYDPRDSSFPDHVLKVPSKAVLIVGHSNTVDDLVNRISGHNYLPADLPDSSYGDLFILHKKGKHFRYTHSRFDLW